MTQEHLDELLSQFQLDANLQEKLKVASDAGAVVAIAKEAGFNITADDLTKAQSKLSDKELESVAGGWKRRALDSNIRTACGTAGPEYLGCHGGKVILSP